MRTRKRIISKVRSRSKINKHTKFGIQIPLDINEARQFDIDYRNTMWEDATKKELDKICIAFNLCIEGGECKMVVN